MEFREALPIIRSLADGIDPRTSEPLPPLAIHNDPKIIRAFHAAVRALEWADRKSSLPENNGKGWTPQEDEQLKREFHSAVDFEEIARRHGRSRAAIWTRLERLGEIDPVQPAHLGSRS